MFNICSHRLLDIYLVVCVAALRENVLCQILSMIFFKFVILIYMHTYYLHELSCVRYLYLIILSAYLSMVIIENVFAYNKCCNCNDIY